MPHDPSPEDGEEEDNNDPWRSRELPQGHNSHTRAHTQTLTIIFSGPCCRRLAVEDPGVAEFLVVLPVPGADLLRRAAKSWWLRVDVDFGDVCLLSILSGSYLPPLVCLETPNHKHSTLPALTSAREHLAGLLSPPNFWGMRAPGAPNGSFEHTQHFTDVLFATIASTRLLLHGARADDHGLMSEAARRPIQ